MDFRWKRSLVLQFKPSSDIKNELILLKFYGILAIFYDDGGHAYLRKKKVLKMT